MHIALNAILLDNYNSGVENYIAALLTEFNQLAHNSKHRISAFFKSHINSSRWSNLNRISTSEFCRHRHLRIAWEHAYFSSSQTKQFDLIHAPGYIAPVFPRIPVALTVHDLHALTHPELCSTLNRYYYRLFLPLSIKKANCVIVPSVFVAEEVLKLFDISQRKIFVIPEAAESKFKLISDETLKRAISVKYNLPEKFILFVGNIEPKKNVNLLFTIYEFLVERHPELGLVLVGRWGWESRALKSKFIELHNRYSNLIWTDYITSDDLSVIYNLATVFVFPSLIEGFGIPPLEAMACGVPVVTSNRGAIPEVVGDAAIVIDPEQQKDYAIWIEKMLLQPSFRQEFCEKGREHIKKYSWKFTAQQTLDVYETIKTNF